MAKHDVYSGVDNDNFLLDVQADLFDVLNTLMVAQFIAISGGPVPANRLNPVFVMDGVEYVIVTQFVAAVPRWICSHVPFNLRPTDY